VCLHAASASQNGQNADLIYSVHPMVICVEMQFTSNILAIVQHFSRSRRKLSANEQVNYAIKQIKFTTKRELTIWDTTLA